mmetsp:Transcript_4154/g.13899  ORF Transcript_4154/g.13899 Transcript_4154/m.13899 type:complete len:205 (+) Transcript_4154:266-880(+)
MIPISRTEGSRTSGGARRAQPRHVSRLRQGLDRLSPREAPPAAAPGRRPAGGGCQPGAPAGDTDGGGQLGLPRRVQWAAAARSTLALRPLRQNVARARGGDGRRAAWEASASAQGPSRDRADPPWPSRSRTRPAPARRPAPAAPLDEGQRELGPAEALSGPPPGLSPAAHSRRSSSCTRLRMVCLLVSCTSPARKNSSRIMYTL